MYTTPSPALPPMKDATQSAKSSKQAAINTNPMRMRRPKATTFVAIDEDSRTEAYPNFGSDVCVR